MNKNIPFILTDSSITVVVKGRPYTITDSNASYNEVKTRIANEDFDGIENLFDTGAAVGSFTKGNIVVQDNAVLYKGQIVNNHIVDRILQFMREGLPYKPLVAFLDNLLQNPSFRAVTELYGFLEKSSLPITEDGCFLAYRKVREDYKDFYTGTVDNSVGANPKMLRNLVDEDKDRTCSNGFHFCAYSYLAHYYGGVGRTVMVKINPANVVAIPSDYNNAKGRCSEYLVDSEIPNEQVQNYGALYRSPSVIYTQDSDSGDAEESYNAGYEAGREDAERGDGQDADAALYDASVSLDIDLDEAEFVEGYLVGFSFVAAQKSHNEAKTQPVKRTISEATRQKLREAALRQKRDADGKYI